MNYLEMVSAFLSAILVVFQCLVICVKPSPIAIHQLVVVNASSSVVVRLKGYDSDNPHLQFKILSLPKTGKIYQLSQVFSDYGYMPIHGSPITSINTVVTGSQNRFYYSRPLSDKATNIEWDSIEFIVTSGAAMSSIGIITFVPSSGSFIGSDFSTDNEGWTITGNRQSNSPSHYEKFTRGEGFSNYIFGTENLISITPEGIDKALWYFDAPPKFFGNYGLSYGGFITFSLTLFSGDLKANNGNDVPLVILECSECSGPVNSGLRLAFPISAATSSFTASSSSIMSFQIELSENSGWLKDSQNSLNPWLPVTKCDLIQVLSRLSGLRILGDLTPWYETVALDNVQIFNLKGDNNF